VQDLNRELSRHSSRAQNKNKDVEAASESDFDLLSYLQGDLEERENAGFKTKALGVAWQNLRVVGAGGDRVRFFPFLSFLFFCREADSATPHSFTSRLSSTPSPTGAFMYRTRLSSSLVSASLLLETCSPVRPPLSLSPFLPPIEADLLFTGFDGSLRPGEMCLVLGRPGSGWVLFFPFNFLFPQANPPVLLAARLSSRPSPTTVAATFLSRATLLTAASQRRR
jgi:hypothetical protein